MTMYKKLDIYDDNGKSRENLSSNINYRQSDMTDASDRISILSADPDRSDEDKFPKSHLTFTEIIVLNLTYTGVSMIFLLLSVVVVPAQVESIVGSQYKGMVLGFTVAVGAVATFIIGPLVGMKSDRLVNVYGRRRPIIFFSVILLSISCVIMVAIVPTVNHPTHLTTFANVTKCVKPDLVARRCMNLANHTKNGKLIPINKSYVSRLWLYIPLYLVVISSYVATITPYNALIADKSHPDQRGLNSGAMGGMILLGNLCGAALGLLLTSLGVILTVCIGLTLMLVCVTITMGLIKENPVYYSDTSLTCKEKIKKYWLPLKDHDFRWLFLTRFFMQQGLTSIIGFLEYWLNDMIELPLCWNTYRGVSLLLLPMLICAALSSVLSGIVSDRLGKRKIILTINAFMMAIVVLVMLFLRGPYAYYFAIVTALIFGIGLGGFQSVDFALLMDIIPDEKDQSLMIAVWHQAMILPQALAVPIAGLIVDLFERVDCRIGLGYIVLLLVICFYFCLSGSFIRKIKSAI